MCDQLDGLISMETIISHLGAAWLYNCCPSRKPLLSPDASLWCFSSEEHSDPLFRCLSTTVFYDVFLKTLRIEFSSRRREKQFGEHTTLSLVIDTLEVKRANENFLFELLHSFYILFLKLRSGVLQYLFVSENNSSHVSDPCTHMHITAWAVNSYSCHDEFQTQSLTMGCSLKRDCWNSN